MSAHFSYLLPILLILLAIIAAYAFAVWRVAKMRGLKRVVLAILLATPPVLIIWTVAWSATISTDVEVLAYHSFDGNQAAVLSQYVFLDGYSVKLAYRGVNDPDWNLHSITIESSEKWQDVCVTNTLMGDVMVYRGKERQSTKYGDGAFFSLFTLVYKDNNTIERWYGSAIAEKHRRAVEAIDGR